MTSRSEHNRRAFAWLGLVPPRSTAPELDDPEQLHAQTWRSVRAMPGIEPQGCLHHGRRGRLVLRHTTADASGRHLTEALDRAYPAQRELRLMVLLRRHELDDTFWRMVFALMAQGGGRIRIAELVAMVCRLTWTPEVADAEAVRLYRGWLREGPRPQAATTTQ